MERAEAVNRKRKLPLGVGIALFLIAALGLWIAYENDVFLPQAHIAIGYMEWGERKYYPNDGKYCYEIGEKIAKDEGYYIFSLKGDVQKEYQAVAQGTGWGVGQFSLDHTLFTQGGYAIPHAGTASGIVVASYNSRFGKYVSFSEAEAILRKIQELGDEGEGKNQNIVSEDNSSAIWICYDNCPVSSILSGYMKSVDGQLYFITENASYPISDMDVVEEWKRISKMTR